MTHPTRTDPPLRAPEAETLLAFLDYHRATFRAKVAGLDQAQLAQTLPPSTMTLGGMVKHLALVEDSWALEDFLGEALPEPWASVDWDADRDWEWHSAAEETPEQLLAQYDESLARVDRVLAAAREDGGLDAVSVRQSRKEGEGAFSLRWILVHLIEEYARHNGHADLIRESIDGATGE